MFITEAILCLALNVYHEAKNQPFIGQVAVAQVVMNRVYDDRYPDHPCEVVFKARHTHGSLTSLCVTAVSLAGIVMASQTRRLTRQRGSKP